MPKLNSYVRSFYHTKQKKLHYLRKKNVLIRSFLKTMVGAFCATCTVTGYPCFFVELVQKTEFFVFLIGFTFWFNFFVFGVIEVKFLF